MDWSTTGGQCKRRWNGGTCLLGRRTGRVFCWADQLHHQQCSSQASPHQAGMALEDGDWWARARPEQPLIKKIKRSDGSQQAQARHHHHQAPQSFSKMLTGRGTAPHHHHHHLLLPPHITPRTSSNANSWTHRVIKISYHVFSLSVSR